MEAKRKFVKLDEEIASGKAEEAQLLKNECESDLAEAIPALEAALSALDTLKVRVLELATLCFSNKVKLFTGTWLLLSVVLFQWVILHCFGLVKWNLTFFF